MRILIAEDEPTSRRMLEVTLSSWGYEVLAAADGQEAWHLLQDEAAPQLLILDWMMPVLDGLQLIRRLRKEMTRRPFYIILLTARVSREEMIQGLEAEADDYVTKPFDRGILKARIQVGVRVIQLQSMLAERVRDLEKAVLVAKRLRGLIPICSYCKSIRNDANYWEQLETYIAEHSEAEFSHGVCPSCYEKIVRPQLETIGKPVRR